MEILDAIYHRRAVREFTDKPVAKATINELMNAAIHAPSAMNSQPWAFCVIQDKAQLKRYSDRARMLMVDSPGLGELSKHLREALSDPAYNIFYNASTLIVICAEPKGQHPDWDCCLAAQTLMLAAHGMGLATCPIGFAWQLVNNPDIRKEMKIPDGYIPVLPIIVGYAAGTPAATARKEPHLLSWREPAI